MEEMLLGDFSSSDDDSDDEAEVIEGGVLSAAAASFTMVRSTAVSAAPSSVPPTAITPEPAPLAPPPQPSATSSVVCGGTQNISQSEIISRLKSLYSQPASAKAPSSAAATSATTTVVPPPAPVYSLVPPSVNHVTATAPIPAPAVVTGTRKPDPFEPTPLRNILQKHQQHATSAAAPVTQQNQRPVTSPAASVAAASHQHHQQHPSMVQHQQHHPAPAQRRNAVVTSSYSAPHHHQQNYHNHHTAPSSAPPTSAAPSSSSYPTPSSSSKTNSASSNSAEEAKKRKEHFLDLTRVLMKYKEQKDSNMHARAGTIITECYNRHKQGDPAYASLELATQPKLRETLGPVYWKKAEDHLNHYLRKKQEAAGASQGQTVKAAAPGVTAPVAQQHHPGASHPPQRTRFPHPSAPAATGIQPPSSSTPVYSKPSNEQQQQPAMPSSQTVAPNASASLPPGVSQAKRAATAARYATMNSTGTNTGVANNLKPNTAAAIQATTEAKKEAARVERAKRTAENRRYGFVLF